MSQKIEPVITINPDLDHLDDPAVLARVRQSLSDQNEGLDEMLKSIDDSKKVTWQDLQMEFTV